MSSAKVLILGIVCLSATANGQVPPGQFDRSGTFVAQNVLSERIGACVVRKDRRHAAAYVVIHNGDPAFKKVLADLMPAMTNCLEGARSATLDASYLRGGIAEGLLQENDGALLGAVVAQPIVPPVRIVAVDTNEPVVSAMACATGAQPASAVAMLRTVPDTVEETAAFRALLPSLQACAPVGGELRFSPPRVRPAVAIAVYRRVVGR